MRNIRSLVFFTLAVFLLIPLTESWAATSIDSIHVKSRRIGPNTTGVRLLSWVATGNGTADSLKRVTMTSYNERTYAGKQYQLYVWDKTDSTRHLLKTINTINIPFQTNDKLSFSDCLWEINVGQTDTFYITMDANTDHVKANASVFDTTGVKIKILDGEMYFISDPAGAPPPDTVRNPYIIENLGICVARPTGTVPCFEVEFDTEAPNCSLLVSVIYDGCKIGTVDLGDSIFIRFVDTTCFSTYPAVNLYDSVFQARNFPETVRVDLAHYMTKAGTPTPTPFWVRLTRPWSLRYMIPDSTVWWPIDTLAGLNLCAVIRDSADNYGTYCATWDRRVDTKKPWFDDKDWAHFWNVSGLPRSLDSTVAIGDSLSFTVVTTSTNFIPGEREVDSVVAHFYQCGLVEAARDLPMADVGNVIVNGNTIWTLKIATEGFGCPRDLEWGQDPDDRGWVVFTAWDNGCNVFVDSVDVNPKLDLNAPDLASWTYTTLKDMDQNGCTNLGDSVRVRVSLLEGVTDVVSAYADYLEAGIGSLIEQPLTEQSDSVRIFNSLLIENDPGYAKDDNPLKRIGDLTNIYDPDIDYSVEVTVEDDAGNTTVKTMVLDGGLRTLDTRRPLQVLADSIQITQLPYGALKLKWPRTAQDVDAAWFYVYSDSGKGGNVFFPTDPDNAFGSLRDREPDDCDTLYYNCWTSDALTHGATYKFVVRSLDNCGNFELNQTVITGMADAYADKACVQWPITGGNFGPLKPLTITATTTAIDIDFAWAQFRKIDVGGFPGPWYYSDTVSVNGTSTFFIGPIVPGTTAFFTGDYELFVFTQDFAGNVLTLDSARTCPAFEFRWNSNPLDVDILTINGAGSPQSPCGYNVWRDSMNTAVVTVIDARTDPSYVVDGWVIYWWDTDPGLGVTYLRDSTRIEFKDQATLPYTFEFSVNDWPKSNDGIPTMLYVGITDTTNYAFGVDSVKLCVPDVVAPALRISYPTEYMRVPIAKSSLNSVPVRATILSTSYDPDNPIRCEFFYSTDEGATWVKIGEDGTYGAYFEVSWFNGTLEEGWVWLKANVYDQVNNTSESPWIKVWLDGTAPEMVLSIPQAVSKGGSWHLSKEMNDGHVDLVAEIVGTEVDIKTVEFFISYRDSVDLVKWYHKIGEGYRVNNGSIWNYKWDMTEGPWSDWEYWNGEFYDTIPGWLKCGFDYKLRIKVTDIAGNVFDDNDGDGQFDDYTFWDQPFVEPIELQDPADASKMVFTLDCGAPQVAIYQVETGGLTFVTPSSLLGGPAEVFAELGDDITVQSITLDSLNDLDDVHSVVYYFYSPVEDDYVAVGTSSNPTDHFQVTFNPEALGLIREEHIANNEYDSYIYVELYDNFGQMTDDEIDLYILDTVQPHTWWRKPQADAYVWGTVDLKLWVVNGEDIKKVTYYYKPFSGGDWTEIYTVWKGDADWGYKAYWATLNMIPDGKYTLGFAVTDKNDNEISQDDNYKIVVNVQNALPTVTITAPDDSPQPYFETEPTFITVGELFKASVSSTSGVENVQFEYKWFSDEPSDFQSFDSPADQFPPYEGQWSCYEDGAPGQKKGDNSEALGRGYDCTDDGWFHFRAVVTNRAGRQGYSPWILCYNDATAPFVRLTTISDGTDTYDIENANDPDFCFPVGTDITFTAVAFDSLSPYGTSNLVNSGMDSLGFFVSSRTTPKPFNKISILFPADSGHHSVSWATSGLKADTYYIIARGWDKMGNESETQIDSFTLCDKVPPFGLVAGFYHCKLVGLSEENASVLFQYRQGGGDWTSIGFARRKDTKRLFFYEGKWVDYGAFVADWAPADGNYDVRMLAVDTNGNWVEENSPVLSMAVNGCNGTATGSSVLTGFGPGTIQKSHETPDCEDLDGLAKFSTSAETGMPYGIAFEYNEFEDSYEFEIIEFRSLAPQQASSSSFAGPFDFRELTQEGGWGWGHVFFFDYSGEVSYSTSAHLNAWWITEDLGTGGPVTGFDGDVSVSVPSEFTSSDDGGDDLLVIWDSELAPPGVWQNWRLTPIGNGHGRRMYYIGNPGDNCVLCGDEKRYATIVMNYDPTVDLEESQLMVASFDGDWWDDDNISFPQWDDGTGVPFGFNTEDHTVKFAVTCIEGFYAVVQKTVIPANDGIVREGIIPWCEGEEEEYTGGYPQFWYRVDTDFPSKVKWSTLQVELDDSVTLCDGDCGGYVTAPKVVNGQKLTSLGGDPAIGWLFLIDETAARLYIEHLTYGDSYQEGPDYVSYPALGCGQHTLSIRVGDSQLKSFGIDDDFMVDCESPDVDFANSYVTKNPTIEFTIDDDASGVYWDNVHVDVFFVTKMDTTAGGPDGATPKERVAFIQTFFPGQIQDYRDGNTVRIPTTYELDDERAVIVVVFDGSYGTLRDSSFYEYYYYYGDPGEYNNFDMYYQDYNGVEDCVGNNTTPHVQYLSVDYEAPKFILTSAEGACPSTWRIVDDGSGITGVKIFEDGVELTEMEFSASDVDSASEFYYAQTTDGGVLYYCPTPGKRATITVNDEVGNITLIDITGQSELTNEGLSTSTWAAPVPFDPDVDGSLDINFKLSEAASVSIKVYDMGGDLVQTVASGGSMGAGTRNVSWNGTTDNGTRVANGVYLVYIEASTGANSASAVVKVAVIEK